MKIGDIVLSSNALLAPIAGFTDVGFRDVARRYGAGLTYTEMISCKGMVYGSEKTRELLATTEVETPCAVQIFGSDSDIMAKAVTMPEMARFDIIDINMGCPVHKIVANGEGSALMLTPHIAENIVRAVREASGKPVTVKFRKGYRRDSDLAVDFARRMQDAGAAAVTVHGRTREQFYSGEADWECIARVAESVEIPVIANGDVTDVDSYNAILQETGADGVMIARGALGNPQIFRDICIATGSAECVIYDSVDAVRDIMRQIEVLREYYSDRYIYTNMKKQICYYLKGIRDGKEYKEKVCRVESVAEMLSVIDEISPVLRG